MLGSMVAIATRWPRFSAPVGLALVAGGLGVLFLLGSFVWLALDHSVPVYDAGMHMWMSLGIRDAFLSGHLLKLGYWFGEWTNYPPLVHVVGAIGMLIGGLNPDAPVVANLLVFVPLLVGGCYVAGRGAYGPLAGVLSVVFALGSPALVAQLHAFMLDAPETALVASSVAALLASDRFRRIRPSALAGLFCGLGLMTKQSFIAFIAGIVAVMLVRGGWRERRGVLAFTVPVLIVAGPWYIYHFDQLLTLSRMASDTGASSTLAGSPYPPRWSMQNLTFYLWSAVNLQLIAPLCVFALVGTTVSVTRFVRLRDRSGDYTPELVVGALVGWIGMSWQAVHDPRYMLPATVYLAVLGVGWIGRLPRPGIVIAIGLLATTTVVNTLGDTFGVGRPVFVQVGHAHTESQLHNGRLTLYSADGYQGVSVPRQQSDLLPVLRHLRSMGIRRIVGIDAPGNTDFSAAGLIALADLARLRTAIAYTIPLDRIGQADAYVIHTQAVRGQDPCVRLYDGTGVWFTRGNPLVRGSSFICARR